MFDSKKDYLIPPEGDKDVGKAVFTVLGAVIADKEAQGIHKKFRNNYKLRRGKHWNTSSTPQLTLATANLTFTHIERTKNELTDNNPTFNVANIGMIDESQKEICTDLQRATEHWWIDQEQQDVLESSVLNGEQYGICIEKSLFNAELEFGLGEVETEIVDPFYFGWYPTKLKDPKDINNPGKCEAVVHFFPKSVRTLRAKYPALAKKIKSDTELLSELNDDRREIFSGGSKGATNISISGVIKTIINFMTGTSDNEEEETVVCELWLRDPSQQADGKPETLEDGRVIQNNKPKYTGGIRYILACSGGVVLEDKDNPNINKNLPDEEAQKTYLYDKFPFTAVNSIKDTSNAWGCCYDDETEILTKSHGFVRFAELLPEDEVATRDKNGNFEWQKPIKYTNEAYNGEMYQFFSSSMNICVTPKHKMLVGMLNGSHTERVERTMLAEDFANGLNHERKIPVTSMWNTEAEVGGMTFPASSSQSNDITISGDDYCALMGTYLAEGSIRNTGGVEVAQARQSKGYDAYSQLFERIDNTSYDERRFTLWSKSAVEHFKQFGKAYEKWVPSSIRNASKRQLKIFWDYFVLGDGCFRKVPNKSGRGTNNGRPVTHISTVSRKLADHLVEIGQKLGFSVAVSVRPGNIRNFNGRDKVSQCRDSYVLTCRNSNYMSVKCEKKQYDGRIYCVTVPNGIIYVRRNGKPTWCGNSDIEQVEGLQKELNKSLSQSIMEKDRMVRAKIVNPNTSGVPNDQLTNYVGVINPNNEMAGDSIHWLVPPPPTGDIEKSMETLKQLFLMIVGTFDLDMAQTGNQVIAYKAIAALLERAATMKRGKIRNYGRLIRERGRMYLSHVMNFYTEERWITFNDTNGIRAAKPIIGSQMIIPAKLTVVSGSTLPISRVQQRDEAIVLYDKKAIDQQELLEKIDWSNRNEVIKRMQAGPLGFLYEALGKVGIPDEYLQYIKSVADADPKKLEKAIKDGQFPTFEEFSKQLMQDMAQQGQIDPNTGLPIQQKPQDPEMVKTEAEVKKIEADIQLIEAKVQTEAVNQYVSLNGVQFDEQKLAMERAKAVNDMEDRARSHDREDVKAGAEIVSNLNNQPGYNERGLKSNNKQE